MDLFPTAFGRQEAVSILNAAAPGVFKIIEDAIFFDILLNVVRLVDPPKSAGRPSLSLQSLGGEITEGSLRDQVLGMETQIRQKAREMQAWRNKKLAQNDLPGHLAEIAPLPSIRYNDLFTAFDRLRRAMNLLHFHYNHVDFRYEQAITESDGKLIPLYLEYEMQCLREDRERKDLRRWKRIASELNAALLRPASESLEK